MLLVTAIRAVAIADGVSILTLTFTGTFDWFAIGMAIATISVRDATIERLPAGWLLAGAAAAAAAVIATRPPTDLPTGGDDGIFTIQHAGFTVVATLVVLAFVAVEHRGGSLRRVLASRTMQ